MSRHDPFDQEPAPRHTELDSLEEVRVSLAEDVIQFLALADTTGSDPDTPASEQLPSPSEDRQVLLRAAVVDLEEMDERLHHARH